ncbi:alpha-L-fucosidase [Paraglaciecola hydrolytica]|uniref:Alpha-L-fucosidase n=1 Tax=Paraglaciecola hydrolytica TaxID=1799789 RepID=A0A136A2K1_9ALTE|nr:alpha-L-fucosidase [Paraglaciecola hydrolytica]
MQTSSWQHKISGLIISYVSCVLLIYVTSSAWADTLPMPLALSFTQPALDWESESLPIGNGALGANVMGGINEDILQFAEKTLWTGGPQSKQGYDFGLPPAGSDYPQKLKSIQNQLSEQNQLTPEEVAKVLGRDYQGYGSYQSFASVKMNFFHNEKAIRNYQRSLQLNSAVARVTFTENDVVYKREYFVSYPDQAIVTRICASQKGKIHLNLSMVTAPNRSVNYSQSDQQITLQGVLNDNGLQYASILSFHHKNGKTIQHKNSVEIIGADELWYTVVATTNYRQQYPNYRGTDALSKAQQSQEKLLGLTYENLLTNHENDYRELFSRVTLDLKQQATTLSTPALLAGYQSSNTAEQDRALEVLYFQYGRYLLISSSRAGSLPANLQGVWNQYEHAPWSADYHVNINLQMNYWLADVTNLPETLPPLFDFIDSLVEPGAQTALRLFDAPGWTLLLNTNIWGFTGLIAWPTAFWQPEGAAWMAQHYFEHYRFTLDQDFLTQRAYPVMLGASEFWLSTLQKDQQGNWLISPSYSPEHGNFTAGAAMSQQIIYDLLTNTSEAAGIVGDAENQKRISKVLANLAPGLLIGSWGQLQEWRQDLDDKSSEHRHVSQLYALHPGNQLSPLTTPELAQAALTTLNSRGDGGTGWSKAWKINFWARLLDGDRAHKVLSEQLLHSTLKNLWDNHPPYQIDGNFGATAGIAEMLLQSHLGEIHLLPALPSAWPNGQISGLKARGGITVELAWLNGKLQHAMFNSQHSQIINIRCTDCTDVSQLRDKQGNLITMQKRPDGFNFIAKSGVNYRLLVSSEPLN